MLFALYLAARLVAFVMIFVCLGLAIRRARTSEQRGTLPALVWAFAFVVASGFLAII